MRTFTQGGRITSLHGFLFPPKKKQVVKKYLTVSFVIPGTIPSKKNMIWADNNVSQIAGKLYKFSCVKDCVDWLKENVRSFVRNSKKYTDWVEEMKPIIREQSATELAKYEKYGLSFPLTNTTVSVYHYWADNMARDNSNKYDSIIDLFVSCGILSDDSWQIVEENKSASQCYYGEILQHLTRIDITERF